MEVEYTLLKFCFKPPDIECVIKNNFLISQPKHMFCILKRTVCASKTYFYMMAKTLSQFYEQNACLTGPI